MGTTDNLVADAAARLFATAAAADDAFDAALWQAFRASGLAGILAEGGIADAVAVLRPCGSHGAAIPAAEAVLGDWLASRAGLAAEEGLVAVATVSTLKLQAGKASGEVRRVPWGRHADVLYAVAGTSVVRIAAKSASAVQGENMAGEPRDTLRFDAVPATEVKGTSADELLAMAALLRAAQMVGAMERSLDLSLEHATQRQQFGRPISAFQAVQQMLSLIASHTAAAAAAVDLAAQHATGGLLEAAIAKSRAGEAAGLVAENAHQVIAAMGFTREHPLHRCTRRLWSWRDECGNEAFWNAKLGEAAARAGEAGVWPMIADGAWPRGAA